MRLRGTDRLGLRRLCLSLRQMVSQLSSYRHVLGSRLQALKGAYSEAGRRPTTPLWKPCWAQDCAVMDNRVAFRVARGYKGRGWAREMGLVAVGRWVAAEVLDDGEMGRWADADGQTGATDNGRSEGRVQRRGGSWQSEWFRAGRAAWLSTGRVAIRCFRWLRCDTVGASLSHTPRQAVLSGPRPVVVGPHHGRIGVSAGDQGLQERLMGRNVIARPLAPTRPHTHPLPTTAA